MGAGAGYTVKGVLELIKINNFKIGKPFIISDEHSNNLGYQVIPIKCDIDCVAEDIYSASYMYGGTLYGRIPIKITEMSLISYEDIEDISEIDEDVIDSAVDGLEFEAHLGWGWVHSTFDGNLIANTQELQENEYSDFYFNEIIMHITNNQAIEAIDTYVLGDNYSDEYKVVDIDGDTLEYFEDYDEAIAYAKENNGYEVLGSRFWYEYALTNGGDVESEIFDIDDDIGKDWTNPDYIEE